MEKSPVGFDPEFAGRIKEIWCDDSVDRAMKSWGERWCFFVELGRLFSDKTLISYHIHSYFYMIGEPLSVCNSSHAYSRIPKWRLDSEIDPENLDRSMADINGRQHQRDGELTSFSADPMIFPFFEGRFWTKSKQQKFEEFKEFKWSFLQRKTSGFPQFCWFSQYLWLMTQVFCNTPAPFLRQRRRLTSQHIRRPSGERLHSELENHHFSWEIPLFLWPFSIAMFVHWRVLISDPLGKLLPSGKRLQRTMERSTILNGKTHYFDWATFNSELLQSLPEGNY